MNKIESQLWKAPHPEYLPNFIIGGAMKCGTTTLHHMLATHPDVFMPKEEIHFFDIDNILQHADFNHHEGGVWISQSMQEHPEKLWNWYAEKFKANQEKLCGEDSTTYLASETAAQRIAMQEKSIKLLFLLRQPTNRAYSHYYHLLRTGRAMYDFEETIRFSPHSILERSLYKEQLENWYKHIPKERIKVIVFEQFIKNPRAALTDICNYLKLDPSKFPETTFELHANKARLPKSMNLQLQRNKVLRSLSSHHYKGKLPISWNAQEKNVFTKRLVNKTHAKLNPKKIEKPQPINQNTKNFLDSFFARRLEGLNELIGLDVMSLWFP